ncbi:MAG TPA: hypothetical protein DCE18_07505 [Syntrophobacteraceae bacterium]|nr:hypothetical protein [Syntrophobacteraceae bacterium]
MKPPREPFANGWAPNPELKLRPWQIGCGLLALLGLTAFVVGALGSHPLRAWQTFLVNYLFWLGIACGSVLFVAILNLTNAHWARPMKRLAEAPAAFLPVALVLLMVLVLGREHLFPWVRQPVAGKSWWLNVGFLFGRDGLGLLVLTATALGLVYHSVKADLNWISKQAAGNLAQPISPRPPTKPDAEETRNWRAQVVLSPIYAILYALVLSLIAIDFIMSLDSQWVSTLFGAYYFIGSLYTALAMLLVLALWSRKGLGLEPFLHTNHFHDLGKLLLGFCLVTGDFFYSQFLVIWYGNLPEEAKYVILRIRFSPWEPLAWTVLVMCFALPFVVLLSRKIKMKPFPMMVLCVVILVGMWLERFLLVAPSLWKGREMPLGLMEIAISTGFLGIMGGCVLTFLQRFPIVPVGDPLMQRALEKMRSSEGLGAK